MKKKIASAKQIPGNFLKKSGIINLTKEICIMDWQKKLKTGKQGKEWLDYESDKPKLANCRVALCVARDCKHNVGGNCTLDSITIGAKGECKQYSEK